MPRGAACSRVRACCSDRSRARNGCLYALLTSYDDVVRGRLQLVFLVCVVGCLCAQRPTAAAELEAQTTTAYERHMASVAQAFAERIRDETFLQNGAPDALARMRRGEILLAAGTGDGISNVPKGLIHHWRAAAFIPNVTLERLLAFVQDYSAYADAYDWLIASQLIAREGDEYRAFFRVKQSAGVVTGVVDMWMVTDYRRLGSDRIVAVSKTDCVRQVEHAGDSRESRLRPGTGSGYLWRADALSKYLQRDGGVYVELDAIGLSRGYPALLGWIIEPIARRLGRESAAGSLNKLRAATISPPTRRGARGTVNSSAAWCGG
jgi:hypothetical protein